MRRVVLGVVLALVPAVALAQDDGGGGASEGASASDFETCGVAAYKVTKAARQIEEEFNARGAEDSIQDALLAWNCSEDTATPEQVAQFHLVLAAANLLSDQSDPEYRLERYTAARAAAPEVWFEGIDSMDSTGGDERKAWESAGSATETTDLRIIGFPAQRGWKVYLDGKPFENGPVASGRHLLQVVDGDGDGHGRWAEDIVVAGEEQRIAVPNARLPADLRSTFLQQFGEGGYVLPGGGNGLWWKAGGPVALGVGVGGIVATYVAARDTPKGTTGGNLLTVGNTAGWVVAGAGAALLTYGVLKGGGGKGTSVSIGPSHIGVRGRF